MDNTKVPPEISPDERMTDLTTSISKVDNGAILLSRQTRYEERLVQTFI